MQHLADGDSERFRTGAEKYAAYLETPEGRLRLDLAFANLQDFLPQPTASLRALDLGCGTGAVAVRLARLGVHVTLLDSSLPMLNFAERAARQAGVSDRIALQPGDAAQLSSVTPERSFDVVVCHNLLEYADDPAAVLRGAARALRDRSAILSILVRNQAGEVLKVAIQGGDLAAAEQNLSADWARESLYGGKVRLFTPESLGRMLTPAALGIAAERGVRVVSDYLPPQLRTAEYDRVLDLERKLGSRPEFAAIARYRQCLARRAEPALEDRA
jgi:S-adenosylmethionine-dependent methyltransferase